MRRAGVLVALVSLGSIAGPVGAESLGRLFFTPEQREALDAGRRARLPESPASAIPSAAKRIDGYVLRSDGRATVWVNGEASSGGSVSQGLRVTPRPDKPGHVSVIASPAGRRTDAAVGVTLERDAASRDVIDGEIRLRRSGRR